MNTYVVLAIHKFRACFGDKAASLIKLPVPSVGIQTLQTLGLINCVDITGVAE